MRNLTRMAMMRRNGNPRNAYGNGGSNVQNMRNAYGAENRGGGMTNAYDGGNRGGSMEMGSGQYRMGSDKGWEVKPIEDRYEHSGGYGVENRFRDRRGREHYNNGRFAPVRNAYDGGSMTGDYDVENRMPPVYNPGEYRNDDSGGRMIGFYGGMGGQDELSTYRNKHQMGHAGSSPDPFDRKKAHEWVKKMKNADGSTGEHWTLEQASQVLKQKGFECDPAEFYATMNMLWSDYGTVAKRYGTDNVEFWAEMAKSFLMDKDAEDDKLALYYECIVKK